MVGNMLKSQPYFDTDLATETNCQAHNAGPGPEFGMVIWFVARSGSTRLAEVLQASGRFGSGSEAFNPSFLMARARQMRAASMADYIAKLPVAAQHNRSFSFEITIQQLEALFENPDAFMQAFGQYPAVWLIRQDIVAQAVSLAKMQVTGITKNGYSHRSDPQHNDHRFTYDRREIRKWIRHLRQGEKRTEALFRTYKIQPLRLSYERLCALSPADITRLFCAWSGRKISGKVNYTRIQQKLGTVQNSKFSERFRREEPLLLARTAFARRKMLLKLTDITEFLPPPGNESPGKN